MKNAQDGSKGARKDPNEPRSWLAGYATQLAEGVAVLTIGLLVTLFAMAPEEPHVAAASDEISIVEGEALILETAESELRNEKLVDGSVVSLIPGTRVQLDLLGPQRRVVVLNRGEARFTVAKDPTRPFSVQTDLITVVAVGTSFTVRASTCGRVLEVHEGVVEVRGRGAAAGLVRTLKAGKSLELQRGCKKSTEPPRIP